MNIGETARRSGVSVQTLRFYERYGLLPEPKRSASNYRQYDEEAVARVLFIKRAQALGFELAEIQELLRLRDDPRTDPDAVHVIARKKIRAIDERLDELTQRRHALAALVGSCGHKNANCRILRALSSGDGFPVILVGDEEHAS